MYAPGTTAIPNVFWDSLLPTLKPGELKVLLVILRATLGWHKDQDWISSSQFIKKTGLSRKAISLAISELVRKNLVALCDEHGQTIHQRAGRARIYYRTSLTTESKGLSSKQSVTFLPRKWEEKAHETGKKVPPTKEIYTKPTATRDKLLQIKRDLIKLRIIKDIR